MLLSLTIKNFILIDSLEINFSSKLNIITGETGSGKSILLDAILFCFGQKNLSNPVRVGEKICSVTISASISKDIATILDNNNIEYDGEIIIKRSHSCEGRKKLFINDQPVSIKLIAQISDILLEIHSQHSHTKLTHPANNLDLLDRFGELENLAELVNASFKKWQSSEHEYNQALLVQEKIENEIEFLKHTISELSDANVQIGEEENLQNLRLKAQNQDRRLKIFGEIKSFLSNPELDQSFARVQKIISRNLNLVNDEFNLINDNVESAYTKLQESVNIINDLIRSEKNNSLTIEELDERFFLIKRLASKFLKTADQLHEFLQTSITELSKLQQNLDYNIKLDKVVSDHKNDYYKVAQDLNAKRVVAASNLETNIQSELTQLAMKNTKFKIIFNSIEQESSLARGLEKIYFAASTNPGTPILGLKDIASGGELSRIMLAIKVILAEKKVTGPTIIFDEIDTGIGGKTADIMGVHLKKLSQSTQIILVTHQPQIACKADFHIMVKKHQEANNTIIDANGLDFNDRVHEIARMISGKIISQDALKLATNLING